MWHIQPDEDGDDLKKQKNVVFTMTHRTEREWNLKTYPLVLPCSTSWPSETPLLPDQNNI